MFYSVGIDVSMGKSTIAIISTDGEVISEPFEIEHTKSGFNLVLEKIKDKTENIIKILSIIIAIFCLLILILALNS